METKQNKPGVDKQDNSDQTGKMRNDDNQKQNGNRENQTEKREEEGTKLPGREVRTPVAEKPDTKNEKLK